MFFFYTKRIIVFFLILDLPSNIEKLQMFLLPQGRRKNVAVQKIDCNNLTVSN